MRNSIGVLSNVAYVDSHSVQIVDDSFGPTELGLDLLVQLQALENSTLQASALANIETIFRVVSRLPRHTSGLFFRFYKPAASGILVTQNDISSIDNIHLALALWTLGQSSLPQSPAAQEIFNELDFSDFWDPTSGLLGGNLRETNGGWSLESYRYYLGSEARSIYFLAHALGLIKRDPKAGEKLLSTIKEIPIETVLLGKTKVLKVWDGGLFQLFLPTLLIGEGVYHASFVDQSKAVWGLLSDSASALPSFSTATLIGFTSGAEGWLPQYTGKAGHSIFKSTQNADPLFEAMFVPHGAMLAGLYRRAECAVLLNRLARQFQSDPTPAFRENFGWTSAILQEKGAVPGVVAIDKAMETLAALTMASADALSVSARRLKSHPQTAKRLSTSYGILGKRIEMN